MALLAFGINHKTAPVDIREKVAFAPDRLQDACKELVSIGDVSEVAILSTCNRTELYCCVNDPDAVVIEQWFSDYHHLSVDDILPYVYKYPDLEAVRHLLRVASGLDSLVLGEPQILGQVKTAYRDATAAGTVGSILNKLCQHTFNVAKQVRTDTAIGESAVSVAYAAVSLAKQIFSQFEKHTALLIGAGETIELAARHIKENNIGNIIIANRTVERAHALAEEVGGVAIALSDIPEHLAKADIIISSTASPLPILGKGSVERAIKIRKHKPMLMVDIAVPRDIEPEVSNLADVYLYTVDDLKEIIEEGLRTRREAAEQAEDIIENQVATFMGWLRSQSAVTVIQEYRGAMMQIKDAELEKALKMLRNGQEPEEVLKRLANGIINKVSHSPTSNIRQAGFDGNFDMVEKARELLGIKDAES